VAATAPKTWPAARFAALVRELMAEGGLCAGWRLALVGGPGDALRAAPLLQANLQALNIFDEPDLLVVHAALARCAAFIGNDSGLAHLAAAAGIPTLALFGPTDPRRYGPWGGAVVKAPTIADLDVAQVAQAMGRLLTPA
jgi:ADP-heptose:LPS heptosyltransferase